MLDRTIAMLAIAATMTMGDVRTCRRPSSALSGAGIGAVGGAAIAAATGGKVATGAAVGGVAGAAAGYLIDKAIADALTVRVVAFLRNARRRLTSRR